MPVTHFPRRGISSWPFSAHLWGHHPPPQIPQSTSHGNGPLRYSHPNVHKNCAEGSKLGGASLNGCDCCSCSASDATNTHNKPITQAHNRPNTCTTGQTHTHNTHIYNRLNTCIQQAKHMHTIGRLYIHAHNRPNTYICTTGSPCALGSELCGTHLANISRSLAKFSERGKKQRF